MTEEIITRSARPSRAGARVWLATAAVTCGAVLIAGCSSTTPSAASNHPKPQATTHASAGMSTASQAACVHIKSIRTSLASLTHARMTAASAGEFTSALTNIQHQLAAMKGEHLGAFSDQAKELSAEIEKIKKDAAKMHAHPTAAEKSLTADITKLKARSGPMITQIRTVCHVS